ncbi:Uncharacterised protein [Streptococcus anginosus]|uniref:Nuclear transport factor 2 family protein n=2 Tax=Streptococcus TaxID=1301 RepID=A0A4U9Z2R7_STRAP|nr:Uncharacterised protein [Streptococcus milleri]VTS33669.1 Uncharacterised protein [Streptococcus anginosus]
MGKVVSLKERLMPNLEKLTLFFQAKNQRDWETYQSFLHSEIIWELHEQKVSVIRGIEDYLSKIQQAYHQSNVQFSCLHTFSTNENRIVTILKNDFGQLSCDIFEFENGLIIREYKYLL